MIGKPDIIQEATRHWCGASIRLLADALRYVMLSLSLLLLSLLGQLKAELLISMVLRRQSRSQASVSLILTKLCYAPLLLGFRQLEKLEDLHGSQRIRCQLCVQATLGHPCRATVTAGEVGHVSKQARTDLSPRSSLTGCVYLRAAKMLNSTMNVTSRARWPTGGTHLQVRFCVKHAACAQTHVNQSQRRSQRL